MLARVSIICVLIGFTSRAFAQFPLRSFVHVVRSGEVKLQWVIEPFQSCNELVLEHSTDSLQFYEIYRYPGVCGGSNLPETYGFNHSPGTGKHYYRLHMGNFGYSVTLGVVVNSYDKIQIAPNPFSASTTVTVSESMGLYDLIILDMQGMVVFDRRLIDTRSYVVQRGHLKEGLYILIITDSSGRYASSKIAVANE